MYTFAPLKYNTPYKIILLIMPVFFFHVHIADGQEKELSNNRLDSAKWKELTENVDYTPVKPEEKNDTVVAEDNKEPPVPQGNSWQPNNLIKYGLFVVVLVFIAYLIYLFIPRRWLGLEYNPSKVTAEDPEKADEPIKHLPDRLKKAIDEGNYQLAVRLYYLMIIKGLVDQQFINWKRDKTNREYLAEMRWHEQFPQFKKATLAFEQVWYGKKQLDYHGFSQYEVLFHELAEHLNIRLNEE